MWKLLNVDQYDLSYSQLFVLTFYFSFFYQKQLIKGLTTLLLAFMSTQNQ